MDLLQENSIFLGEQILGSFIWDEHLEVWGSGQRWESQTGGQPVHCPSLWPRNHII